MLLTLKSLSITIIVDISDDVISAVVRLGRREHSIDEVQPGATPIKGILHHIELILHIGVTHQIDVLIGGEVSCDEAVVVSQQCQHHDAHQQRIEQEEDVPA